MASLYDKMKREEKYFNKDAPNNFAVYFENKDDAIKALSLMIKYGSLTCHKSEKIKDQPLLHIISRTQLLVLKESGVHYFPDCDKYLTEKGKSLEKRTQDSFC